MILNLPKTFPNNKLNKFYFGEIEAKRDKILNNPFYFCNISTLPKILLGRKSIIIGDKGSGKSALFKLISERKLFLDNENNLGDIILPIEADFDFRLLNSLIINKINTSDASITDDIFKYRIAIEIFFVAQSILSIEKKIGRLNSTLNEHKILLNKIFNIKSSFNLVDFLNNIRASVGVKLDSRSPSVSNFYALIEYDDTNKNNSENFIKLELTLESIKNDIQHYISLNNHRLIILLDKLDDFLINEEYSAQKKILNALISTEDSYYEFDNINIFIFLRPDLFERLDLNEKIRNRRITLDWNKSDIIEFISKRLCYNYFNVLKLNQIRIDFDENVLYFDDASSSYSSSNGLTKGRKIRNRLVKSIVNFFKINDEGGKQQKRIRNLNDELNLILIASIFPDTIEHLDMNRKIKPINFVEFLLTHTSLSTNQTNPRFLIQFLNELFSIASEYYRVNNDVVITLSSNRYPIFFDDIFLNAYKKFKSIIIEGLSDIMGEWKDWFLALNSRTTGKFSFKYSALKQILNIEKEKVPEFNKFLAYLHHIGYLECTKSYEDYEMRSYRIPILFRNL